MVTIKNIQTLWLKNEQGKVKHKYALTVVCPLCGQESTIEVFAQDYFNWTQLGYHAQDAFPYLSANEREMLISGICPKCWDKVFEGDSEEEEEEG